MISVSKKLIGKLTQTNGLCNCDNITEDEINIYFAAWALFKTNQMRQLKAPKAFFFFYGKKFLGAFKANRNRADVVEFYSKQYDITDCLLCGVELSISKDKLEYHNLAQLYAYAVLDNNAFDIWHHLNNEPHYLDLYSKSNNGKRAFFDYANNFTELDCNTIFREIYNHNIWNCKDSKSGCASQCNEYTNDAISCLHNMIKKYHIETLIDAPCGEAIWIQGILKY